MRIFTAPGDGDVRETFLSAKVEEAMQSLGDVTRNPFARELTCEEIGEYLRDADVVVTGWGSPMLDARALAKADSLRLLVHTGGSVASVAGAQVYERGIRVISGNVMYAESVAEGVICYILAALRRVCHYSADMAHGGYRAEGFSNKGLLGRSVSLVGFGAIPRYLVPMLRAFRCEVSAYDKYAPQSAFDALGVRRLANLEEAFSEQDIVSVHLPWNSETEGLITGAQLKCMRSGALLVNTARGAVIDETALKEELVCGRINAVLDVYHKEPPEAGDILRTLPNVLCMPHMAGPTLDRREGIALELVRTIPAALRGESTPYDIDAVHAARMTVG